MLDGVKWKALKLRDFFVTSSDLTCIKLSSSLPLKNLCGSEDLLWSDFGECLDFESEDWERLFWDLLFDSFSWLLCLLLMNS